MEKELKKDEVGNIAEEKVRGAEAQVNIYLKLPKGLTKEEFNQAIQYFKENGAKYNSTKKQWYVSPDLQEKFQEYLPGQRQESAVSDAKKPLAEYSEKSPFIGYAYTKGPDSEKKVVFGRSREEILKLLNKWNENREPDKAYITCSIGEYQSGKYQDYTKYDIRTGKNITRIYLDIPNGLSKEEFMSTIQYFKENGAQFSPNPRKKGWYVFPEQTEKFLDYLPVKESGKAIQQNVKGEDEDIKRFLRELAEEVAKEQEKVSIIQYFEKIDNQYVVTLKNGENVRVSQGEILGVYGCKKMEELTAGKVMDVLEDKVREHMNLIPGEEYDISVSRQPYDNRCTIYKKSGQMIELYGDQVGVMFTSMEPTEVQRVVKAYMEHSAVKEEQLMSVGKDVKLYMPVYSRDSHGFVEISGMETVSGVLRSIDSEKSTCAVETKEGLREVNMQQLYDQRQAFVMSMAIDKEMSGAALDLIGDPNLSAAQMEEVYGGLRDGLSIYQVANYANPSYEAWQMDVYRYGMENGIPFHSVKEIVSNSTGENAWESSRNLVDKMVKAQRNLIIKDLKDHKLVPEKRLIQKIEMLNGATGKLNSVQDILSQDVNSVYGDLKKELGSMIKRRNAALAKAPMNNLVPVR